jgi:hypothetical protein
MARIQLGSLWHGHVASSHCSQFHEVQLAGTRQLSGQEAQKL